MNQIKIKNENRPKKLLESFDFVDNPNNPGGVYERASRLRAWFWRISHWNGELISGRILCGLVLNGMTTFRERLDRGK